MNPKCWLAILALGLASLSIPAAPLRIACIGDSITEGAGLSNPAMESYPARLQRLLGTNFMVRNYGVSARTLLKKGDFPYWDENAFKASHDFQPDVVIIKLGTNDSKPQNWRHGTNFISDFEELIASYAALASTPRVILCTPAPVYRNGAFGISAGIVATNIAPAVRDLASRLGLTTIDFQERLAGHAEWFPDTNHPNSAGMAVLTAIVFDTILGPPSQAPEPRLEIERSVSGRTVVQWPAKQGGMVLQSSTLLGAPTPAWSVVDRVATLDGVNLRLTNNPGTARYLRLWRP